MKSKLVLLILAVFLVSYQPHAAVAAPVIINPGFEEGWHSETRYWTPEGGPFYDQYQEITPPEGWTAWWREGFPCSGTDDWRAGRPEVRVISAIPDPARVHGGEQAAKFFTFWRCSEGGLLQQVRVILGQSYTARAYMYSWYSQCSTKPHSPPLDSNCETPIDWAHNFLSIGLDPEGGINPLAPSVVWGRECEIYGEYGEALEAQNVIARTVTMTVFLRSQATHPLKHVDSYYDDVTLFESHLLYFPLIKKWQRFAPYYGSWW